MNFTPPCIVCGTKLETPFPFDPEDGSAPYQPNGATRFTSHGHYGSMFDPMDDCVFIQVNVCDSCLQVAAKANLVGHGEITRRHDLVQYSVWDVND